MMISIRTIVSIIATIIGWFLIAGGGSILAGMIFNIYIMPPKLGILLTVIGTGILIAGQRKSAISLVEYMMFIGVVSIMAVY